MSCLLIILIASWTYKIAVPTENNWNYKLESIIHTPGNQSFHWMYLYSPFLLFSFNELYIVIITACFILNIISNSVCITISGSYCTQTHTVQKNIPLTTRPIAIIPREDSTHKYPCINLLEVHGLVQKYLDATNT